MRPVDHEAHRLDPTRHVLAAKQVQVWDYTPTPRTEELASYMLASAGSEGKLILWTIPPTGR
jgi:hypothetical protein